MKNITRIILTILIFCAYGCSSPAPDLNTADGIRSSVQDTGAYNTLRQMGEGDEEAWKNFYANVAAGEEKWLQLVPLVIGATDAGYSGALVDAMARALPKNPEGVLALEGSMVSMKQVCSMPFNEPTDEFIDNYVSEARAALGRISDAYFDQDKKTCLSRLNATVDKIEQRRKGEYNFK